MTLRMTDQDGEIIPFGSLTFHNLPLERDPGASAARRLKADDRCDEIGDDTCVV